MVRVKDYMQAAYDVLKECCSATYLQERPQAVADKTDDFLIISLNTRITNGEIDDNYDYHTTKMSFWVYVRDKKQSAAVNQINIFKMDEILQDVLSKFPIVDNERNVKIHSPKVNLNLSDENGWHMALVEARLTTYF